MRRVFAKKLKYDGLMDEECIDLCDAMNSLPGIVTINSCCGHGLNPYSIFFRVTNSKEGLFFLTRCVDYRYWEYGNLWKIELIIGDTIYENGELPIIYHLTSNSVIGENAYAQAKSLIKNMEYHLNHEKFFKLFNLNINNFVWRLDSKN